MYKKEYSQLTFADDYIFCKILSSNKDLCKELLELTLGIRINRLEITENQVSMEHKFDARGIRLDIYVEDDNGSIYDIEMQPIVRKDLPKRTRYYQGMIDLNLISRGAKFNELKRTYIIFICTEDPFKNGLPVYTFDYRCKEDPELLLGDEATKVIINATGNRNGLSDEMSAFLDFILTGKGNSSFTHRLEAAVESAKTHKEWEVEYMTLYAKIQEEREEAATEAAKKASINQIIETCRKYHISDANMLNDIMTKFELTKEEALDFINEYDKQLA